MDKSTQITSDTNLLILLPSSNGRREGRNLKKWKLDKSLRELFWCVCPGYRTMYKNIAGVEITKYKQCSGQ